MGLMAKQIQCKIQVGDSVGEFWVADDLLSGDPSPTKDRYQDSAMARVRMEFVKAYQREVVRRAQA
jgi:hypothetical protein